MTKINWKQDHKKIIKRSWEYFEAVNTVYGGKLKLNGLRFVKELKGEPGCLGIYFYSKKIVIVLDRHETLGDLFLTYHHELAHLVIHQTGRTTRGKHDKLFYQVYDEVYEICKCYLEQFIK